MRYRDFLGVDRSTPRKVDKPAATRSVIGCDTCHNPKSDALTHVTFPSGVTIERLDKSARCMLCHQGRQAGANVDRAASGLADDAVSDKLAFLNVHYRAAAATLYGSETRGGFEYAGKAYHGKFRHPEKFDSCIECHDAHTTKVRADACGACHQRVGLRGIRMRRTDYDGDGNTAEGVSGEIETLHAALGKAIQAYAKDVAKAPIAYDPHRYPYFFADRNGNGVVDRDEASVPNAYKSWTPRLLRAAYNYQFVAKDPGVYSHNPVYGIQLLYDSIDSLAQKVRVPVRDALKRP